MTSTSGMALPSLFVEFRGLWSGEPGVPDRFRPVAEGAGRSTEDLGHVGAQVVLPAVGDEGEELAGARVRDAARTLAPLAANCALTRPPVFPVAPTTRISAMVPLGWD